MRKIIHLNRSKYAIVKVDLDIFIYDVGKRIDETPLNFGVHCADLKFGKSGR